jgi:Zinc finger, C2H2 type
MFLVNLEVFCFQMTIDYPVLDGLICSPCIEKLEEFYKTREMARDAEESYFKMIRGRIPQTTQTGTNQTKIAFKTKRKVPACDKVKGKPQKSKPQSTQKSQEETRTVERVTDFRCDICQKFLCNKYSLQQHIESIHQKIKNFKCGECDYSTYYKMSLLTHSATHSDARPFVCNFKDCTSKFKLRSILRIHLQSHSDLRPYKCHCGKTFKTCEGLSGHRRLVHKKIKRQKKTSFKVSRKRS